MAYADITLTTKTGLAYQPDNWVQISNDANNYIIAIVRSYNASTGELVVIPQMSVGSGTYTNWTISLTGAMGSSGTNGTTGTSGTSAQSGASGSSATSGSSGTAATSGSSASSRSEEHTSELQSH